MAFFQVAGGAASTTAQSVQLSYDSLASYLIVKYFYGSTEISHTAAFADKVAFLQKNFTNSFAAKETINNSLVSYDYTSFKQLTSSLDDAQRAANLKSSQAQAQAATASASTGAKIFSGLLYVAGGAMMLYSAYNLVMTVYNYYHPDYEDIPLAMVDLIDTIDGDRYIKYDVVLEAETNDKGEEKIVETKVFPSYVLVKMTMTDESWHVVRNITGVTGFVGPGSEPTPLTDEEVEFAQVERRKEFKFKLGDKVKVVSGIFEGYEGILQEIAEDEKSLVVLANTGKRDIPIMVETKDVKKAD